MEHWDTLEEVAGYLESEFIGVSPGTHTHKLLKFKRDELRKLIAKAIEVATINPHEIELYRLCDERDTLQASINTLPRRPPPDHPHKLALADINDQLTWIRTTKLKGVQLTPLPMSQSTTS